MAELSLRDRFFTPRVARAITSPSGILAAGGGLAVGIVTGLPVVGVVALGAAAWAGRVAAAMDWRQRGGGRIDPFTLQEPWRSFVQDALSARGRFREAVDRTRSGPLQETLRAIAGRVDTGVDECWLVAQRGDALVQSRHRIDTAAIDRDLTATEASLADTPDDPSLQQILDSLHAQKATADRMDRVIGEARTQLRLLDARLDEAVVRAVELSAQASTGASASSLSSDVDSMVTDMEALRLALEETHGTAGGLNQASGPG